MTVQYCSLDTSEQINELDLTLLAELFKAVGWGKYTNLDRKLFLQWAGEFTVAVKLEGRIIACGMAVKYNGDCARLCCIITHPDFQGKGLARQVTQKLLDLLHEKGIQCVELDASGQGKTLYEKLGFRSIGNVHCYHLNHTEKPESKNGTVLAKHHIKEVIALDSEMFGLDRGRILSDFFEHYPEGTLVDLVGSNIEGFICVTPRNRSVSLGPCVHKNPEGARKLFQQALANHPGQSIEVHTIASNPMTPIVTPNRG